MAFWDFLKTKTGKLRIILYPLILSMIITIIVARSVSPTITKEIRNFESIQIPLDDKFASIEFKSDISSCWIGLHESDPQNITFTRHEDMSYYNFLGPDREQRYFPYGTNVSITWYSLDTNITCSVSPNTSSEVNITRDTNTTTYTYFDFVVLKSGSYLITFTNPTGSPQNFSSHIRYEFPVLYSESGVYLEPIIAPYHYTYDPDRETWVDPVVIPKPLPLKGYSYITFTNRYDDAFEIQYRYKWITISDKFQVWTLVGTAFASIIAIQVVKRVYNEF